MLLKNPQPEEKTTGLLLHSIPHLSAKFILKILTPSYGLLTLIGRSKNKELFIPYHVSEWIYRPGRGDIDQFIDGSIEERFIFDSFPKIQAAGQIAKDLLRSQLPAKNAGAPFELAKACLKAIKSALYPEAIFAAFRLKLLRAEGILDLDLLHELKLQPNLNTQELEKIQLLCISRSFGEIQTITISDSMKVFLENLFTVSLNQ